nr:hypothetical protein [Tanacetum cinerariifolium]
AGGLCPRRHPRRDRLYPVARSARRPGRPGTRLLQFADDPRRGADPAGRAVARCRGDGARRCRAADQIFGGVRGHLLRPVADGGRL